MTVTEDTIDATLEPDGQLRLARPPGLAPGPVQVTVRSTRGSGTRRGLADVIRELLAEQRSCSFVGRSGDELRAEEAASLEEDAERDRELDAARHPVPR